MGDVDVIFYELIFRVLENTVKGVTTFGVVVDNTGGSGV